MPECREEMRSQGQTLVKRETLPQCLVKTNRAFRKLPMNLRPTTPMWPNWSCEVHIFCRGKCTSSTSEFKKQKKTKYDTVWLINIQTSACWSIIIPSLIVTDCYHQSQHLRCLHRWWQMNFTGSVGWVNRAGFRYLAGRGFVGRLQLLWQLTCAVAGCVIETQTTAVHCCARLLTTSENLWQQNH